MPPSAQDGTLSANIQMGGRPWIWLELMLKTCAFQGSRAEMSRSSPVHMPAALGSHGDWSEFNVPPGVCPIQHEHAQRHTVLA
jgi:hypothetical protein